jgi:hypothetical protein
MDTVDPCFCPLCGRPNECGIAQGAGTCWCFTSSALPVDVLDRIPLEAVNFACICRLCAKVASD